MIWYLQDPARSKAEREALEGLAHTTDWLKPVGWRTDNRLRLILDFEIMAGGRTYALFMRYPESFPHSPPSLFPKDEASRVSDHQYGPGGELCLEIRADNWTPDLMGFQMVESAYRLLSGENPAPNERALVPSAHRTTLGQDLRNEPRRLVIPRTIGFFLPLLQVGFNLRARAHTLVRDTGFIYVIDKILISDSDIIAPDVPSALASEGAERTVAITRIAPEKAFPSRKTLAEFTADCAQADIDADADIVIVLRGTRQFAYRILKDIDSVIGIGIVRVGDYHRRLADDYDGLHSKTVGLVGCGSLGSKIATSLARSGVGNFILVDDDVLTQDNLVRNDLDWRDVGLNKADALANKIKLVRPTATARARRVRLAGQETAESADDVLISLASCDLIIDATANAAALNVISGLSSTAKRPVIWAEVFAGGIGGLVARHRPGLEPSVPLMRRAIENWFAEQDAVPVKAGAGYDQASEENPLIADDADVGAIAAPATKMAIDTLMGREPSFFPHSVYAIGLSAGSVFTQPFEVFPIGVGAAQDEAPALTLSPEAAADEVKAMVQLITGTLNEAAAD